jgi:hypothetical protein
MQGNSRKGILPGHWYCREAIGVDVAVEEIGQAVLADVYVTFVAEEEPGDPTVLVFFVCGGRVPSREHIWAEMCLCFHRKPLLLASLAEC